MSRKHHYVKILPEYYIAIEQGIKTFEIRFNDRNYKVGDILHLQEFCGGQYTSRELTKEICYMIDNRDYCKEGFVVLGIMDVSKKKITNTCNTCNANKVCNHDEFGFENCENYIPGGGTDD